MVHLVFNCVRKRWIAMARFNAVNEDTGQALVEFALVLPILLLLLTGIISYGLYINAVVSIQQSARVGAREASLGTAVGCPGDSAKYQVSVLNQDATVYGVVDDQINQSVGLSTGSPPNAIPVLTPQPNYVTDSSQPNGADSFVTVSVTMPYHPVVPVPGLLPTSMQITQTYSMMMEGAIPTASTCP